jgi:Bacterial regulatory protein, Fis family
MSPKPVLTLAEAEQAHILKLLRLCDGNRTQAAKLLGISIRGLRIKLRDYERRGINVPPSQRVARVASSVGMTRPTTLGLVTPIPFP